MPVPHADRGSSPIANPAGPGCGRVQLWHAPLDLPETGVTELSTWLTDEERRSAASCQTDRQRRRYIVARGFLRAVLAARLGCPPPAVQFAYGAHGKPALAAADATLDFNLSHSGELAVIALTDGAVVGVDVEPRGRRVEHARLAPRVCSPAELACYAALPEPQRGEFFLRLWTRKEAFVKATGEGIWRRLAELELATAAPGAIAGCPPWHLYDLELGADYLGALVIAGPLQGLDYRRLDLPSVRA